MKIDHSNKAFWQHGASIVMILVATLLCFAFSLNSLFLFDDFPNLDALVHIQDETLFSPGFWEFVLGGNSGPTGRPVSLLTFALQAGSWPDNPAAFKLVNLLIHCVNSLLVYAICYQITKVMKLFDDEAWKICLFTSLIWAIHPIHTTVVLYAIQRMALLSNCFILLGIFFHMHIRHSSSQKNNWGQLVLLSLALTVTGLLSLFSKENAPSLIFFLLILEYTVLTNIPVSRLFIYWRRTFLCLPAFLTIILPLFFISTLQADFAASYEYSMLNRLMTESRILWQYLGVILLPSNSGVGLFHDIDVSLSLFSPLSTLVSLLLWLALFIFTIIRPGKQKILLLAVLWYFAAHIIESTILPLELFFNHRNYLAFFGLVFAAAYYWFTMLSSGLVSPRLRLAFPVAVVLFIFAQTLITSNLWRDPMRLSESWYLADSTTKRNAEFYAITLANNDFDGLLQAATIYEQAFTRDTGDFRLLLNRMNLSCNSSFIPRPDDDFIIQSLNKIDKGNRDLLSPLQQLVSLTTSNSCNIYSPELLNQIISRVMTEAPEQSLGLFEFELANLYFYTEDFESGIQLLQSSFDHSGDPGVLFTLSLRLINDGQYEQALKSIDQAIERLKIYNNIRTGTRNYKLSILEEMRKDVSGFIAQNGSSD